ncbi:hypothetical protein CAMGR0001_1917 [Campylobacter gracilis RM3268]|uniref:Uncharacterized protein n=1 Tax=Campylobacter gracilis RM3268 TaxID=553220 RepID=C8PLA8_9BACT|nr:hypothetical protein CAMGR0001_1917 [Campylobacter gracilis RM3268]
MEFHRPHATMKFVPFTSETLAPSIRLRYGSREIYPFIAACIGILEILIRPAAARNFIVAPRG